MFDFKIKIIAYKISLDKKNTKLCIVCRKKFPLLERQ